MSCKESLAGDGERAVNTLAAEAAAGPDSGRRGRLPAPGALLLEGQALAEGAVLLSPTMRPISSE